MATKSKKTPKHSGFEAPEYGTVAPNGAKMKKLPNGIINILATKANKGGK